MSSRAIRVPQSMHDLYTRYTGYKTYITTIDGVDLIIPKILACQLFDKVLDKHRECSVIYDHANKRAYIGKRS